MTLPLRRILIVKTSSLGDVVHNAPAVSDIAAAFPGARIDWVVEEAYASIVEAHEAVSRVVPVAIRRWRKALLDRRTWSELASLRQLATGEPYDAILDTQGLLKSAIVARLARGPHYGYRGGSGRERVASMFYDKTFTVSWAQHAVDRCRQLAAAAFGYEPAGSPRFGLRFAPSSANGDAVLLFHGTARREKEWPAASWSALARGLAEDGLDVLLPWGNDREQTRAQSIAASVARARVLEQMPLDQIARLIVGARGVVGVDVAPERIDYVVNSHLHFDHCGGNEQIPNATLILQRPEWEAAHEAELIEKVYYDRQDYDHGHRTRLVDGEHDIFGDGSAVCLPTPGHTPGHQSLRVRIGDQDVVLTGDACYLRRTLEQLHLPTAVYDREQMLASLRRLRALRDDGAVIVTGHDPEMWQAVPQAPAPLTVTPGMTEA